MPRGTMLKLGLVALAVLLAFAWFDGGYEPLHDISEPVDVPGAPR